MSELLTMMKEMYIKAENNNFEWRPIYPNNMIQNGIEGIFTDMFFENNGKYRYIKFSIIYQSRCDRNGLSHPEEGTAFYILHVLIEDDLEEKFQIPEPGKHMDWENPYANLVNDYGRFRYAFNDEETAKSVISHELLMMIYPYVSLLSDAEAEEWNQFVVSARSNRKKVLGLTDIELLLRLASELVCQLPRNAEFIDAEGNHLGYGVNRITRFSAREERRKNLQFRYLNIEECQELKELSFSDVEDLSVEDIKKQYLCASLPMARKAFREDHVAMTELVAGPEIPDDYLDAIFCLAWKKELQLWCLWWTQNKHEGERI